MQKKKTLACNVNEHHKINRITFINDGINETDSKQTSISSSKADIQVFSFCKHEIESVREV